MKPILDACCRTTPPKPQFDDPIFKQWEAEPRDKYLKIHYGDLTTIVWAMLRRFKDKDAKSLEERDWEIADLKNEKQALLALAANHKNMRKEDLKAIESANAGLAEEIMKSTALEAERDGLIKVNEAVVRDRGIREDYLLSRIAKEQERSAELVKSLETVTECRFSGCSACGAASAIAHKALSKHASGKV